MEEIAESHRVRAALRDEPVAVDDRASDDLVLDEVFQRIHYTENTLGRHALYHRLRVAHTTESLRTFESLVTRLSVDAAARERAQLALNTRRSPGLQPLVGGPAGCGGSAGADAAFPVLALVTLVLIPAVVVRLDLLPALIGVLVLNFVVQLATFRRIDAISTAFRQIAPLVATAQALRFIHGEDVDSLVAALRRDTRLLRLKTISRWVSGDPLMLSVQPNMAGSRSRIYRRHL